MTEFEIFEVARELENDLVREAFLQKACADDAAKLTSVRELLKACFQEQDRLQASTFVAKTSHGLEGRLIGGRYTLLKQIGEGGMGTVYMAQESGAIRRKVALKLVRGTVAAASTLARFEAERQALAIMDHTNIARCFDAGQTESGELYFVMELVTGVPINHYCDENRLSSEARIRLFLQVCHGVQHAHQKGVIHRDLKPGNILVAEYDGEPIVKIIDFGLAKALGEPLTDSSVHTLFGQILGTVRYMSPEQATFNQLDIDTRTDVYSLAVVLYELLTGDTPLPRAELQKAAVLEQLRLIREVEPARAGSRLSSSNQLPDLAAFRQTDSRRLIAFLQSDIDQVLMKGLERDRNRRYSGAAELAADLERFLNRQPVLAVPPSRIYYLQKYIRRHWRSISAATLVAMTAMISVCVVVWKEFDNQRNSARAEEVRRTADLKLAVVEAKEALVEQEKKTNEARAELLKRESAASEYFSLMGAVAREEFRRTDGWAERSWKLLQEAVSLPTPLRDSAEWRSAVASVIAAGEFRAEPDWIIPGDFRTIDYSDSGNRLAVVVNSNYLRREPQITIFDTATGEPIETLKSADNQPALELLITDGLSTLKSAKFDVCRFAVGDQFLLGWTRWGRLCRWDFSADPPVLTTHDFGPTAFWHSSNPDGSLCFIGEGKTRGGPQTLMHCWDTTQFCEVGTPLPADRFSAGFEVVDGDTAVAHADTVSAEIDLKNFRSIREFPSPHRGGGVFHPDGDFFVRIRPEHRMLSGIAWPGGETRHTYDGLDDPAAPTFSKPDLSLENVMFSPSGNQLMLHAKSSGGTEVVIWDGWGGKIRTRIPIQDGSSDGSTMLAMTENGERLSILTFANSGVRQYSRVGSDSLVLTKVIGHPGGTRSVRMAPDNSAVALLGEQPIEGADPVMLVKPDAPSGRLLLASAIPNGFGPSRAKDCVSFSPDGRWLVASTQLQSGGTAIQLADRIHGTIDRSIELHNAKRSLATPPFDGSAFAGIAWTEQGELIVAADWDLFVWKLSPDQPPVLMAQAGKFSIFERPQQYVSVSGGTGRDIWAVTLHGELRHCRVTEKKVEQLNSWLIPGAGNCSVCRMSPDRKCLAIGKTDGSVTTFDVESFLFSPLKKEGHPDAVQAIAWLDAQRLVTGARDGSLVAWRSDSSTGLDLWYQLTLEAPISDLCPASDGKSIYIASSHEPVLKMLRCGEIDDHILRLQKNSDY